MVETRAALGEEGEKGDSFEYSQRGVYAPPLVFTSTPGTQSIPSMILATHSGIEKRRKYEAEKSERYFRHSRRSGRKTHTNSDQDADPQGAQQQKGHFGGCTASRPQADFGKKRAPHLDESNDKIWASSFGLDNTHSGK